MHLARVLLLAGYGPRTPARDGLVNAESTDGDESDDVSLRDTISDLFPRLVADWRAASLRSPHLNCRTLGE